MAVKEAGTLALSTTINDLDALLEECMVGNGSEDKEGFDYFITSLEADSEESKAKADDIGNTTAIIVMSAVIIAFFAAIVMGIVISRSISKPVVGMTEAARKIREGNLDVSVDDKGSDEIAELGKAFNQMVLSVRLVAGEMGMDTSAGDQDDDPEPATGEPNGPSPASKDN
jgi:methyl-accepting chemotaxis protein